ncbi:MAG: uracil-DNA glycosylase [Chloroflexi bacterium HGW-Chloroflexi-6]|nr:MAG: uracil-DNA glycosylase [Chloroflexi bacterium HGW-Chloroflexi-6]
MELKNLNAEIMSCRKCPRLVEWREQVAREKRKAYRDQEYWGKPVPGFGDPAARVFVIGLAPGAHGSNRTGRQFTGDASGSFLYPALHRAGFANQPEARSRDDGLILADLYMAAAARCAPPDNKPTLEELANCQPYLERELELIQPKVIVALGRIAFERVLRIFSIRNPGWKFAHGALFPLPNSVFCIPNSSLICSYHPSQQNTLTGKLTVEMFDQIWAQARTLLET